MESLDAHARVPVIVTARRPVGRPVRLDALQRRGHQCRDMNVMTIALAEARLSAARGEVPVGAVVVGPDGAVLGRAGNRVEADCDAAAHAELLAMRAAARVLDSPRLSGCDLVVTLEPCPMCAAAAVHFRIRRVVFGAYDPKGGGVEHGPRIFARPGCLHRPEVVGGVGETEASALLKEFFVGLRA